jgi:zinc protease
MLRRFLFALLLIVAAPATAQQVPQGPEWPFAQTDLPVDPAYRFGTLPNGMRYIIRPNATPAGQGSVQFWVDGGAIDEREDERGFAHFVEHMAFNGSTNVPEGEMVRLLEREGLAFGADTNASTGFDTTLYRLDLPRNDPALLDTALMLMREVASELSFDPEAVEREKGVILSERRVRDTYALRNTVDDLAFQYPGARFPERLPIGVVDTLQAATAEGLRGLWQRLYRPENTALIVVGEFDADAVEAAIRERFGDWRGPEKLPRTDAGPVPFDHAGATGIYLDPALSERITVARHGPWLGEADTLDFRQRNVKREIAYGIINRRLQRLSRSDDPPFQGAGIGTGEVFEAGRTSRLIVDAADGEWRRALLAAQEVVRRALEYGFTEAEVAEQLANLRTSLENNVASANTRHNNNFVTAALTLLDNRQIPTTPQSALARFEEHLPQITPASVLAALQEELAPLDHPLIRFEGRIAPEGGAEALRAAWDEGMAAELSPQEEAARGEFDYSGFGAAGTVVSDTITGHLGIRQLVFVNGLKLNLKPTQLQEGRVMVQLNVDGGQLLNTAEQPLATAMASVLPVGGLGRHSTDELQSILAGRSVDFSIQTGSESFTMAATTTPRDLELQLQLLAAALTDPGYRREGEYQYRRNVQNFFARRDATPENAVSNALGAIISDDDPRFTLQPLDAYLRLSFEDLRAAIGDRLENGALELALVGDFDEERAIQLVAETLGALPPREPEFRTYEENRTRAYTNDRTRRIVHHSGAGDQALIRLSWPTRDDSDLDETLRLELLERVLRLELVTSLREELGQTYSPSVSATQSRTWRGWGQFAIAAAVDKDQVEPARKAMLDAVRKVIEQPIEDDVLLRARQPMLESYDNALKSNSGWMSLVSRAQTTPERIERHLAGKATLATITAEQLREIAARYLAPEQALEVLALPREAAAAAPS